MKKVVFIALLFAALLHAAPDTFFPEDWTLGTVFPSMPTIGARQLDDGGTMYTAVCETPDEAFISIRVQYEAVIESSKLDAAFDAGKGGMLSAMSAVLVSENALTVCGHPARHYVLEEKNKRRRAECYVVIAGDEIYQFMHAARYGSVDSPAVKSFFEGIAARQVRCQQATSGSAGNAPHRTTEPETRRP